MVTEMTRPELFASNVLMAWNEDLGDGLEWADDPEYPANYSAFAFKFVSNVIVYAMTH